MGWQQGDQVVPSNSLGRTSFNAASPARTTSHASNSVSSQASKQQSTEQGWNVHRELLVKRAGHQQALQNSSKPPISVFSSSSAHPPATSARQTLSGGQFPAHQSPDRQAVSLQRRQNHMHKLPEGGFTPQIHDGPMLRQEDGSFLAGQSKTNKLPARNVQRLPALPRRPNSYPQFEGLKRAREPHTLDEHRPYPALMSVSGIKPPSPGLVPGQAAHGAFRAADRIESGSRQQQGQLRLDQQEGRIAKRPHHQLAAYPSSGLLQGPLGLKSEIRRGARKHEGRWRFDQLSDRMMQLTEVPQSSSGATGLQTSTPALSPASHIWVGAWSMKIPVSLIVRSGSLVASHIILRDCLIFEKAFRSQ